KLENKSNIAGYFRRSVYLFKQFYTRRAIVRFYYNIVFYLLFLTLFSFVLLVDYFPLNNNGGVRNGVVNIKIPIAELFVHILVWCMIIEEGTEFQRHWNEERTKCVTRRKILRKYFSEDLWNVLDFTAITCYLGGFVSRFIINEPAFIASKILMCLALYLWYIRVLQVFAAYERLGPKLLMIFNTWGMWKAYGEVELIADHHYGNKTQITMPNNAYGTIAFILTIFFVCIASVLLLNVLVALFNVTIQNVERSARKNWAYHRYRLVMEYAKKSHFSPPFNVVAHSSLLNNGGHGEKVQTFDLDQPLKITSGGLFLALGFKSYSLSPISVRNRNEYSTSMTHVENSVESKNGRNIPVVFANYPNRGAAFSFTIDELDKISKSQSGDLEMVSIQKDTDPIVDSEAVKHKPRFLSLFKFKSSNKIEKEQDKACKLQRTFNDHDNMLLENSIAEDYWRSVINKIKEQESASTDERNNSLVTSLPNWHANYSMHQKSTAINSNEQDFVTDDN
ncbi:unnamed protein product, partial [Rotaria sordida]